MSEHIPRRMTSAEYEALPSGHVSFDRQTPGQRYPYGSEEVVSEDAVWLVRPESYRELGVPSLDAASVFLSRNSLNNLFDNQFNEPGDELTIQLRADARMGHPFGTVAPARIGGYEGQVTREIAEHLLSRDEERVEQAIWMQENTDAVVQQLIDVAVSEHLDLLSRDIDSVLKAIPNGLWIATISSELARDIRSKEMGHWKTTYRFAQLIRLMQVASVQRGEFHGTQYSVPIIEPVVLSGRQEVLLPARTLLAGPAIRWSVDAE